MKTFDPNRFDGKLHRMPARLRLAWAEKCLAYYAPAMLECGPTNSDAQRRWYFRQWHHIVERERARLEGSTS